jgi:hypothetical protein
LSDFLTKLKSMWRIVWKEWKDDRRIEGLLRQHCTFSCSMHSHPLPLPPSLFLYLFYSITPLILSSLYPVLASAERGRKWSPYLVSLTTRPQPPHTDTKGVLQGRGLPESDAATATAN